ncbi:MAG: flagellar hook-length control protein FliK, partial [Paraburkholderia sp.]
MNGIDAVVTSLLANRVDSLLNLAPGSATASQTGAAGVDTEVLNTTPVAPPAAPPASAQTALSAVALTLNAIVNSGGEATPAVLGQAPIWPAAPALDVEAGGLPLFDTATTPAASPANPNTAGTAATANVAAAQVPVAALAAALEQTVAESGLFYESHLAQWLAGQRSPAALADEAQNKLVAAAQLPLDWASDADQAASSNAAG